MDDIIGKLKSDRLWALGAYVGLMVLNVKAGLGIPDEQMTELMWVVLGFIGSKGLRGTVGGNMLEAIVPQVSGRLAEATLEAEPTEESREIAGYRLFQREYAAVAWYLRHPIPHVEEPEQLKDLLENDPVEGTRRLVVLVESGELDGLGGLLLGWKEVGRAKLRRREIVAMARE